MFTGNTQERFRVNPKGEAEGVYIWTVECITCKHQWEWFDWLVLLQAYKLLSCFLPSPCCFYKTQERSARQLLAMDPSYCWLYPSKQAVDHFMHFARFYRVLFSTWNTQLSRLWQQIPLPVLLALHGTDWINSTGNTDVCPCSNYTTKLTHIVKKAIHSEDTHTCSVDKLHWYTCSEDKLITNAFLVYYWSRVSLVVKWCHLAAKACLTDILEVSIYRNPHDNFYLRWISTAEWVKKLAVILKFFKHYIYLRVDHYMTYLHFLSLFFLFIGKFLQPT